MVFVLRNLHGPEINPAYYNITMKEDTSVGTVLLKLNVTEGDNVSTFYLFRK